MTELEGTFQVIAPPDECVSCGARDQEFCLLRMDEEYAILIMVLCLSCVDLAERTGWSDNAGRVTKVNLRTLQRFWKRGVQSGR